jgi:hypothetical protein
MTSMLAFGELPSRLLWKISASRVIPSPTPRGIRREGLASHNAYSGDSGEMMTRHSVIQPRVPSKTT